MAYVFNDDKSKSNIRTIPVSGSFTTPIPANSGGTIHIPIVDEDPYSEVLGIIFVNILAQPGRFGLESFGIIYDPTDGSKFAMVSIRNFTNSSQTPQVEVTLVVC